MYKEGKEILCKVTNNTYGCKKDSIYIVDKIDPRYYCKVTHSHSIRVYASCGDMKAYFAPSSAIGEGWFTDSKRDINLAKLLND